VLFERFGQAWAQAARGDAALSCIMLDIDHFKRCNDTYGHAAGDAVLVEVARRIRTHVRPYDVCARFGGEEFVIICPGADLPTACEIGERVRTAVEGAPVRTGGETIQPTISVGVATRDAAFANPDALIAAADGMLYAAKENGRNQVWWRDHEGQPQPLTALRASS
jgi:two-component system cell cycle response regulator